MVVGRSEVLLLGYHTVPSLVLICQVASGSLVLLLMPPGKPSNCNCQGNKGHDAQRHCNGNCKAL